MRLALELVLVAAILYLGWDKPLSEWVLPVAHSPPPPSRSSVSAKATLSPSGAWMWDPSRHSVLDKPGEQPKTVHQSASGILDPNHRSPLDPRVKLQVRINRYSYTASSC